MPDGRAQVGTHGGSTPAERLRGIAAIRGRSRRRFCPGAKPLFPQGQNRYFLKPSCSADPKGASHKAIISTSRFASGTCVNRPCAKITWEGRMTTV